MDEINKRTNSQVFERVTSFLPQLMTQFKKGIDCQLNDDQCAKKT